MSDRDEDPSDREIRITELKHEAEELSGGRMVHWEAEDCPPEVAERFWENVVSYEEAPCTSHLEQLREAGVDLPAPGELDDSRLAAKLAEVVDRLADLRVFLTHTDHLDDRALYTLLWKDLLREEVKAVPLDELSAYHLDVLGGCSEEDIYLHLKYYADEQERQDWQRYFPDDAVPPHEDRPFDRDCRLPRPTYGPA